MRPAGHDADFRDDIDIRKRAARQTNELRRIQSLLKVLQPFAFADLFLKRALALLAIVGIAFGAIAIFDARHPCRRIGRFVPLA